MFTKGYTPWNKGKSLSPEHLEKVSLGVKRAYKLGIKKHVKITGKDHYYWKGGLPKCLDCDKKLSTMKSLRCKTHMGVNNRGENNPFWRGGLRSSDYIERRKFSKQIRKVVLERDDYTCQLCGERGGDLQVDHIQSWSEYVELRFNIDNCRTLCSNCHYKITFGKPMPPTVRAWGHNI